MELLIIIIYASICYFIFKLFKIPLTKWTVPTAILGGVALVLSMVLFMNYNHPYTHLGGQYYISTPIIPSVNGRVIEVNIKPNEPIKKGDILFKIDPVPYQAEVDQKRAELAESYSTVKGIEGDYITAKVRVAESQKTYLQAKKNIERVKTLIKNNSISQVQYEKTENEFSIAEANYLAAKATLEKNESLINAQINGENIKIVAKKAALAKAEYNLANTVITAPSDGFVSQLLLRPGMMANTLPLRPVMTFIHVQPKQFVGAFRQNSLLRLQPNDEAEFVFPAIPGKTFTGKVLTILPAISENEVQANGTLYTGNFLEHDGKPLVLFEITDKNFDNYHLPYGTNVEIAVYTHHMHHLAMMRKILLRMNSWKNYLYLDH
ncbi:HlyD family secretion protein [Spirabiliibacterium falconis]|uniref:HlyD family secretion protein n=1 Tax=Spirabiliibacterium falconis TaxID=572023 RepID=UPI001AAC9CE2|nr:HlyD family secretion protein [Spirabiliibacterium falconis]MBE2894067.1 HlyD family secretion protein [Spirabiliibacterium falconis]